MIQLTEMANQDSYRTSVPSYIVSAILALMVFMLVYFPLEFKITEIWMWIPKISPIIGVSFLIFLIVIFGLVDWQRLMRTKLFWIIFVVLVVISGFVYKEYRQKKLAREYLPKVYKISYNWGIQAQIIKVEGVNFGPAWKKGKVVLDGEEMLIRSWDEKLIIAEQQVPTKFGQVALYLIRNDEVVSNKVSFEIKDPDKLAF